MEMSPTIKELSAALAKAQANFLPVKRTQKVDFTTKSGARIKYSYAPLSDVFDSCRKALSDNGLAIMQPTKREGEKLVVETLLSHSSGDWVKSEIIINSTDSTPQGIGSALTYARRYALSSLLGIAADEDDDANIASGHPAEQKKPETVSPEGVVKEHWCETHNTAFFKKGKMTSWAHPFKVEGKSDEWCYKPKEDKGPTPGQRADMQKVLDGVAQGVALKLDKELAELAARADTTVATKPDASMRASVPLQGVSETKLKPMATSAQLRQLEALKRYFAGEHKEDTYNKALTETVPRTSNFAEMDCDEAAGLIGALSKVK